VVSFVPHPSFFCVCAAVSLATLNSTVETTFKLIHVLGRCVFKSAQCDELTTQQLLPAEFVIGIVSKEIKRDKGWFDWLISQIDASNLYEISSSCLFSCFGNVQSF
jgi:hypothetical protein